MATQSQNKGQFRKGKTNVSENYEFLFLGQDYIVPSCRLPVFENQATAAQAWYSPESFGQLRDRGVFFEVVVAYAGHVDLTQYDSIFEIENVDAFLFDAYCGYWVNIINKNKPRTGQPIDMEKFMKNSVLQGKKTVR